MLTCETNKAYTAVFNRKRSHVCFSLLTSVNLCSSFPHPALSGHAQAAGALVRRVDEDQLGALAECGLHSSVRHGPVIWVQLHRLDDRARESCRWRIQVVLRIGAML